ncbi:ankyrin repeat-containing domain protein [Podospora fimiseda]|uniref:Ankyrin repeat-containing domain protein n=1 Tax=Podospora fimiseda TaxID=252190 RepID=A0AAN7H5B6_9PEZI|nr:ankyrin repeat-containing domain protein [Podospora fimiseda]
MFYANLSTVAENGQAEIFELFEKTGGILDLKSADSWGISSPGFKSMWLSGMEAAAARGDVDNLRRLLSKGVQISDIKLGKLYPDHPECLELLLEHEKFSRKQLEEVFYDGDWRNKPWVMSIQNIFYRLRYSKQPLDRSPATRWDRDHSHDWYPQNPLWLGEKHLLSLSLILHALHPTVSRSRLEHDLKDMDSILYQCHYGVKEIQAHSEQLHILKQNVSLVCLTGALDTVKILIRKGACINQKGLVCISPLFAAVVSGRKELVSLLLQHGVDPDELHSFTSILSFDHAHDIPQTDDGLPGLFLTPNMVKACWTLVRLAIQEGKLYHTPILLAEELGYVEIYNTLVDSGRTRLSDILTHFKRIFKTRSTNGNLGPILSPHIDECGRLVLKNLVVDRQERTILHLTAAYGAKPFFDVPIKNLAAELAVKDKFGQTPLHSAAICGQTTIVELIVKYTGLQHLHAQNLKGATPLHLALVNLHLTTAQKLVELGSLLLLEDRSGHLPTHRALYAAVETCDLSLLKLIWTATESQLTFQGDMSLLEHRMKDKWRFNLLDYAIKEIADWRVPDWDPEPDAEWNSEDEEPDYDPLIARPDWKTGEEPSQTCDGGLEVKKYLLEKGFNPRWSPEDGGTTSLELAKDYLSEPPEAVSDQAFAALKEVIELFKDYISDSLDTEDNKSKSERAVEGESASLPHKEGNDSKPKQGE